VKGAQACYASCVSWVLRAVLLLAAVMPLFAATALHPAWWQTLIAAAIGSALGQLAARFTRGRRIAQAAVIVVALGLLGVTAVWTFRGRSHDEAVLPSGFLVVKSPSLSWDDVHAIQTLVPAAEFVVPYLHSNHQLASEDQNWNTSVVGTTPDYLALMDWHLAAGEPLDASRFKVVLLGDTVAKRLFGAASPIGGTVRIDSMPFEVIGVLARHGSTAQGQDLDDVALISVETYMQKISGGLARRFDGLLFISPKSRDELDRLEADVRSLLHDRHLAAQGNDDDVVIRRL
jgi:MacB-like periplasmic core domain